MYGIKGTHENVFNQNPDSISNVLKSFITNCRYRDMRTARPFGFSLENRWD